MALTGPTIIGVFARSETSLQSFIAGSAARPEYYPNCLPHLMLNGLCASSHRDPKT
jgi:hypothetical protein